MELSDVFIFKDEFTPNLVREFFAKYLQGFKSLDSYYECPKYGKETVFETDSFLEMFEFVLEKKGREFTFYLSNDNKGKYIEAILQINKDGSMCLALSAFLEFEKDVYNDLKTSFPDCKTFVSNNTSLPMCKEGFFDKLS